MEIRFFETRYSCAFASEVVFKSSHYLVKLWTRVDHIVSFLTRSVHVNLYIYLEQVNDDGWTAGIAVADT